jgi:hypothetical protein
MNSALLEAFPKEFSTRERCQALAMLDEVESAVRAYEGDFTAPWLLSPINAIVWRISKGNETRTVDGELTGYYEYGWATTLHDGSNLGDAKNRLLLQGLQRLAFLARELPGGPATLTTFKAFLWSLNLLVRWTFVHGDVLDPRRYAFTKMTRQHFTDFFVDLGRGGTVFALQYPQRLLQSLFPMALGREPTDEELCNPGDLSLDVRNQVSEWLRDQGHLRQVSRSASGEKMVCSALLAKLIDVDVRTVRGGARWKAFIGQFGASADGGQNTNGLLSIRGRRELPTQRAVTSDEARDAGVSEKTLAKYFDDINTIVALHRHLPNVCPDPMTFRRGELRQVIVSATSASSHTPWVPLRVAMAYMTEALRWVHVYGEDLVSIFLHAYRDLFAEGALVSAPKPVNENPTYGDILKAYKITASKREQYVAGLQFPDSLTPLRISGWASYVHLDGQRAFEKLRSSPSVLDAIMVLVGAIAIVVAMTKPMRESEFRALKRDCLLLVPGDGYWLSHDVRKKNIEDIRPLDARPIPYIAAKAIQLLRRLTDGIKEIIGTEDPWLLDSLVTLPTFGRYEASIDGVLSAVQLTTLLDSFCDYVALAPDGMGRRWYLRIHEMRKSFLITFFWTYRYASLDAARWMAGHGDASHVYAYIQANFPGEELPNLEAEYARQVLCEYQESGASIGNRGVDALYQAVCDHFFVKDVSWIEESTLSAWLEMQFASGQFKIVPVSIRNPGGTTVTEIAFRVTPTNE